MGEGVSFSIYATGPAGGRLGYLRRGPCIVPTPCFMPCASLATVRALPPHELWSLGYRLVVVNALHLRLRPGHHVVHSLGGLHSFMSWPGLIATDSGGFQAFSLAELDDAQPQALQFTSPIDGQRLSVTPEQMAETQQKLGADLIVALDVCAPYPVDREHARRAVDITLHWAQRAKAAQRREDQMLFGVVQGQNGSWALARRGI